MAKLYTGVLQAVWVPRSARTHALMFRANAILQLWVGKLADAIMSAHDLSASELDEVQERIQQFVGRVLEPSASFRGDGALTGR